MLWNKIVAIANEVEKYVEKNHKLPTKTLSISRVDYSYLFTKSVLNPNKEIIQLHFNDAPNPNGDTINKTLTKNEFTRIANDVNKFISTNKRLPNFVSYQNKKINIDLVIYCFAKIIIFYNKNHRMPNTCKFDSNVFKKNPTTKGGAVCKAVANRTGVAIVDYKTLYKAFTHFAYEYYYNDKKTKNTTISDKAGNCADLNQLAYQCLKELGYKVDIVRGEVKCNSGTFGHIWCRLKLSNQTINFDASAAAKGKAIGSLICGTGRVTNINPSWLLSDDGRT